MLLQQELIRIIRKMRLRGASAVELSQANRRVLGRRPALQPTPAPCPMPTEEQKQRAIQAFVQSQRPAPPPPPAAGGAAWAGKCKTRLG